MFIRYHFFLLFEYLSTPPWSRFLVLPLSQSVNSWLGSNFHPPSADMLLDRILYVGYSRSQFLVALWNDLGWSQALADSDSLSVVFFAFTILGGNFTSFPCGSKKVYWNIRPLKCFFSKHLMNYHYRVTCLFSWYYVIATSTKQRDDPGYGPHHSNWRLPGSSKMERWTVYHPFVWVFMSWFHSVSIGIINYCDTYSTICISYGLTYWIVLYKC